MKNTIKQLAAVSFTILLLVGSFKSEGTELKETRFQIIETNLQLENWMTNEKIWNANSFYLGDFAWETETNLELESWMTSENIWNLNNNFVMETEAELELESWMTSGDSWNVEERDVEEELTLESWMLDSNVWK